MSTIPIFPLNLVVFPDSKYPLHIFEERYKILIEKCLREKTGFGIVASFERKISDVGVYVIIDSVIKVYDNGESDIIVAGLERFLINSTSTHPDGYYIAEVEKYSDIESTYDERLFESLRNEFEETVELANYNLEVSFWNNLHITKNKSYKIAEKSGLSIDQQQELLILRKESQRLNYLIDYFTAIKNKVSNAESLKRIIMNDGYIN
jgi:Lon protease-like protein